MAKISKSKTKATKNTKKSISFNDMYNMLQAQRPEKLPGQDLLDENF